MFPIVFDDLPRDRAAGELQRYMKSWHAAGIVKLDAAGEPISPGFRALSAPEDGAEYMVLQTRNPVPEMVGSELVA